jgi:hypothetical protein
MTTSARARLADPAWRLDNLYRVVDRQGQERRFRMNAAQRRLRDDMHALNVILKARQLGFTTFIQLIMLDACLFTPNLRAGTIAHRLEDAEAIFRDKIKFAYARLPAALRRELAARQDSARSLRFANNSEIRVGTSLRSGTFQMLHISEYGKLSVERPDKAREIRTGALNTVAPGRTIWIESTAEGREGEFYDLVQQARMLERLGGAPTALDFRFHFFPWWEEPSYQLDPEGVAIDAGLRRYFDRLQASERIALSPAQQAWYARKAASQGEDMRREYPSTPDEAFEVANEGAYYGEALAQAEREGRIGQVRPAPDRPVETWWDLGVHDATAIWFVQRVGSGLHVIDYLQDSGEGLAHYARLLQRRAYVYGAHVAPHDIKVRELGSGLSRLETARSLGIAFRACPRHEIGDGIEAVRNTLARCWFDAERCAAGLRALRAYRREWDREHGTWRTRPRHDWASHAADAFRTGVMAGCAPVMWPSVPPVRIGSIA